MQSSIAVGVRIRPPPDSTSRKCRNTRGGELYRDDSSLAWKWDTSNISFFEPNDRGFERGNEYRYSRIFTPDCSTQELYAHMGKPIVQRTFEGYNGCIFAYGQTNSGKTHTISGTPRCPGIISLAVTDFFNHIRHAEQRVSLLRLSFLEVYNEQLKDLLVESQGNLIIQDDPGRGPAVVNLSEHVVSSLDQVIELKEQGEARRMFGRNNAHEHASRSHTIFQLIFESRAVDEQEIKISTLSIVDLAGSELGTSTNSDVTDYHSVVEWMKDQQTIAVKAANTQDKRHQQMRPLREREGANIRRSLLALSRVVNTLVRNNTAPNHTEHVPYRDSKLTRILRSALGGNSLTTVIATVNPWLSSSDDKETHATLRFAHAVQQISNHPRQVSVMSEKALLERYQSELRELRTQMLVTNSSNGHVLEQLKHEKEEMETALSEKLHKKSEEGERLQRQFDNLSQFILTSHSQSNTPSPPLLGAGYDIDPYAVPCATDLPDLAGAFSNRKVRRNSFCCLRDRDSLHMFYERAPTHERLKKYQEWVHDCYLNTNDSLHKIHEDVITVQAEKIRELTKQVEHTTKKMENIQQQLDIKDNLLQEDVHKIADKEIYWQQRENDLKRDVANIETKLAKVQNRETALSEERDELKERMAVIRKEKNDTEQKNIDLTSQVSRLKDDVNDKDSTVVNLEQKLSEVRETVSRLEHDKTFLRSEVDAKGTAYGTLEKEYHTMMREKIGYEEYHEAKLNTKKFGCMPKKKDASRPWIPYIPSENEYFTKYHPTRNKKQEGASTVTAQPHSAVSAATGQNSRSHTHGNARY